MASVPQMNNGVVVGLALLLAMMIVKTGALVDVKRWVIKQSGG